MSLQGRLCYECEKAARSVRGMREKKVIEDGRAGIK